MGRNIWNVISSDAKRLFILFYLGDSGDDDEINMISHICRIIKHGQPREDFHEDTFHKICHAVLFS